MEQKEREGKRKGTDDRGGEAGRRPRDAADGGSRDAKLMLGPEER